MKLVDHTDSNWQSRRISRNGAETYSIDLVKYQIPNWTNVLKEKDIISTCPLFSNVNITGKYNVAIQYLHKYPYTQPVDYVAKVLKNINAKHVIFITAYRDFETKLNLYGINAVYVPMSIDVGAVKQYQQRKADHERIIYFGQVRSSKRLLVQTLKWRCRNLGLKLDFMSYDTFNSKVRYSREDTFRLISTYQYGIAVGRCAQELMALDVKTMIAGERLGGLITTRQDYDNQLATNMNGRIITYSDNIETCLSDIDKSIYMPNDVNMNNHAELARLKYPEILC